MSEPDLREALLPYFGAIRQRVMTQTGEWTVKGFIDVYQNVYSMSLDTKVLSKVLELLMYPVISQFAHEQGYELVLAKAQNQYPDISLIAKSDPHLCYALDIKTTYRTGPDQQGRECVNGMTLGTFGGYFRTRQIPKNSTFAYNRYAKHYVLGAVYHRAEGVDDREIYTLDQLEQIPSAARQFEFFLQEKYSIASDQAGSGNTKNIGSTRYLERLLNGTGVFAQLGPQVFDDYWMNYRNQAMARQDGFERPPYRNLKEYQQYKALGAQILELPASTLETEAIENEQEDM